MSSNASELDYDAPTTPPASFIWLLNGPPGDVLLWSSDGVDFRVDLIILVRASPFFSDLFASDVATKAGFIQIEETSDILDLLLRALYPVRGAHSFITEDQSKAYQRVTEVGHVYRG